MVKFPSNVIWKPMPGSQEAFLASTPIFEVLFEGTRGGGKAIADSTLVLTEKGWLRADEVTMSDKLVAGDGSYTKILGIFPQSLKTTYRVEFTDGQSIVATDDHRWLVMNNKNTSRGWQVRTTQQMFNTPHSGWSVPFMGSAHGGKKWQGPDPYLLGLIAGDGTISYDRDYITIYSVDEEILEYCRSKGWKISRNPRWSTSRATASLTESREIIKWVNRLTKEPHGIREADAESRLAFLQGLMDTDGTVDKQEGKPSFCNVEKSLALLGHDLCWSLGGKSIINLKKFSGDRDKYYYQISVAHQNKFNPFRLTRKAELVTEQKKQLKRSISRIVKIDPVPARCFAVDHPDHTFVIEGYIVTHNTDCLLMSFCMHVGKGYGSAWKGILFRQTYKQLTDVITKTKKWIPQIWPDAKFNHSEHTWTWPGGESLLLRQFAKEDDYWNYHGHEYPWIGWEELCNWHSDSGYKRMFSCCRSSQKGMPRMVRATTNPYGPGHNWVKFRFKPNSMNMKVRRDLVDDDGLPEPSRLSIHSHVDENKALLEADPDYKQKLAASARNEAEKKAWLEGSWDIVAGGMFDDVWSPKWNVLQRFEIPVTWKIVRSFDWGASKPFSVGWWAVSNGEDVLFPDGTWRSSVRGDVFRVREWYGSTGKPNEGLDMLASEISEGIIKRELEWGWRRRGENWCRVKAGVADSQIFAAENGNCIATDMKTKVRMDDGYRYPGIQWAAADKRPGSRATGWTQMRQRLKNAWPNIKKVNGEDRLYPREKPGLFIFDDCKSFIETIPVLPRDEKNMDDIDTDAEDHVADETRYLIRWVGNPGSSGTTTGLV